MSGSLSRACVYSAAQGFSRILTFLQLTKKGGGHLHLITEQLSSAFTEYVPKLDERVSFAIHAVGQRIHTDSKKDLLKNKCPLLCLLSTLTALQNWHLLQLNHLWNLSKWQVTQCHTGKEKIFIHALLILK